MSLIINESVFNGKRTYMDPKEIETKVFELLKNKKLTFYELASELKLENGDRELLLKILLRLESEGKIKKEKVQINLENGINLTTRFFT